MRTLDDIRHETLSSPRLMSVLLGMFALLALVITAAGLSGLIAYSVSQRTQEIGIRMALGADRGRITTMVLREGMLSVAVGLALGIAACAGPLAAGLGPPLRHRRQRPDVLRRVRDRPGGRGRRRLLPSRPARHRGQPHDRAARAGLK